MQQGFFKSLFDFSFTSFVTGKVIKFLYILILVLLVIAYVVIAIALFSSGGSSFEYNTLTNEFETTSGGNTTAGLLWLFVFGPIALFLYTLLYRVLLELIVVVFRIYDNSGSVVALMRAQWPDAAATVDASGGGLAAQGGVFATAVPPQVAASPAPPATPPASPPQPPGPPQPPQPQQPPQ
jgi:hypothetical protein